MVALRSSLLGMLALSGAAAFAACSASSAGGHADAGARDAGLVDADDDVVEDMTTPPNDVAVYPEAASMIAPDGCFLPGKACVDDTMCCSANCTDGGCSLPPKQM